MSAHLFLGRLFLRAGAFLRSMAIMTMRPDDLIRLSRDMYRQPGDVAEWAGDSLVGAGLMEYEKALLGRLPASGGRLLLLGVGGGREVVPLAEAGFSVTGVDFVPELVDAAKRYAAARGFKMEGLVQDLSDLKLPRSHFDAVWFSRSMYSVVPTRKRRVDMLGRIREALRPGGQVVCQFHWDPATKPGRKGLVIRRAIACLTLGNFSYEPGDRLWGGAEFVHAFFSENDVRSEFGAAGFDVKHFELFDGWFAGGAILQHQPDERTGR